MTCDYNEIHCEIFLIGIGLTAFLCNSMKCMCYDTVENFIIKPRREKQHLYAHALYVYKYKQA